MRTYKLTAQHGEDVAIETFLEEDDTEATFTAIWKILDRAHAGQDAKTWAKGRITLCDEDGNVIRVMEEKV